MRRKPLTPEQRRVEAERKDWSLQWSRCWLCGKTDYWTPKNHTHEIVRRSETSAALHLANYARLCPSCHDEAHGPLTKGVLMTLKLLLDPTNADIDWLRSHAIRRGIECQPLPPRCDWLFSDAALTERQGP